MKSKLKRRLDKTKLVKEMARDRIGPPKPVQVIPDKRKRVKHKKKEEE